MKYRNYYCFPKFSEGERVYYGRIEGVSEIDSIEAENLNDFERLFHQTVDDLLNGQSEHKTRWKVVLSLTASFLLIWVALVTCPKKDQHVQVLSDRVASAINDEFGQHGEELESFGILYGSSLIRKIFANFVTVDNYFLFSVGKAKYQGEEHLVSVGIFGHIFSKSKERIKQDAKDNEYLQALIDFLQ